ncbi:MULTISPECIES: hypothetical protein [unclassified Undibacterium]|uniref:hypothetical protein n=1 Tax=unclassified Undibacterium TaxID=2630295 RepID=UPI002AC95887|nr:MULTISPECIES: hypothetical protein [unclassified Undibacterium]MEB0139293.1 hypothetical protein [Undibacterium sp. CCC2.1]MEB0172137.1 hypothetical protein [Undibacterium sp. CCC1.1]MEB0176072.1 hypothetical protein [Undibacterium sp. CCC3.4]MEB0215384.1 hypothetical protein [Undibacterium sp. 5I2]WPX43457.1 hypothetical protein RHM61_19130 [Undibacterium sp. CCC3.4]
MKIFSSPLPLFDLAFSRPHGAGIANAVMQLREAARYDGAQQHARFTGLRRAANAPELASTAATPRQSDKVPTTASLFSHVTGPIRVRSEESNRPAQAAAGKEASNKAASTSTGTSDHQLPNVKALRDMFEPAILHDNTAERHAQSPTYKKLEAKLNGTHFHMPNTTAQQACVTNITEENRQPPALKTAPAPAEKTPARPMQAVPCSASSDQAAVERTRVESPARLSVKALRDKFEPQFTHRENSLTDTQGPFIKNLQARLQQNNIAIPAQGIATETLHNDRQPPAVKVLSHPFQTPSNTASVDINSLSEQTTDSFAQLSSKIFNKKDPVSATAAHLSDVEFMAQQSQTKHESLAVVNDDYQTRHIASDAEFSKQLGLTAPKTSTLPASTPTSDKEFSHLTDADKHSRPIENTAEGTEV